MRHDLTLSGPAFRLRPIGDADAAWVLKLRGDVALNRYLHATSASLADQLAWFSRYYERPGDYYFVVERHSASPEGVIAVYDVDSQAGCGEWGRWILAPGSLAAIESAWLIYRCAFELLGLQRVYCRTVADNTAVVSFHDSCGITYRRLLPAHVELNGRHVDAIEHSVDLDAWREIGPRLARLAQLTARRLQHD